MCDNHFYFKLQFFKIQYHQWSLKVYILCIFIFMSYLCLCIWLSYVRNYSIDTGNRLKNHFHRTRSRFCKTFPFSCFTFLFSFCQWILLPLLCSINRSPCHTYLFLELFYTSACKKLSTCRIWTCIRIFTKIKIHQHQLTSDYFR